MNENDFEVGQYVIYVNGDKFEIGQIKSLERNGARVFYHAGNTAALTPYRCLHQIKNDFVIKETSLNSL